MASPRLVLSALAQRLSPRTLPNSLAVRQSVSPVISDKLLKPEVSRDHTPNRCRRVLSFSIDSPNRGKITNEDLSNQERALLGSGRFGTVYRASYKGTEVAVKIVKRAEHSMTEVEAEKRASILRHSGIVRVFRIVQSPVWSMIIMELCSMTLQTRLDRVILSKKERIDTWITVAIALKFCHDGGIVHGDVKPANVLITADGQLKLGDFGSSVIVSNHEQKAEYLRGTPGYIAPEVVKGRMPCVSSDIYSLGVVAWQLLSREPPFAGYHPHTILYLTGKGIKPVQPKVDDECCGRYTQLYEELWTYDVECRPMISKVIDKLGGLSLI